MSYILAQYTIRSKQDYIFRSNRIVEIIGASDHITRSWDVLLDQAKKAGLKVLGLKDNTDNRPFKMEEVEKNFAGKTLNMVELFRGGGNDTILFDNIDSYHIANCRFSRYLLETYPGMIPMAVCCEYTGDYKKDYENLMAESEAEKNRMISGQSSFILPFSMMDRNSFQPFSRMVNYGKESVRLTEENYRKRNTGRKVRDDENSVKILDDMVTKHGEESLLAVIHADGNNMGSKIGSMLGNHTDYNLCVQKMREFTKDTANAFVTEGLQALEACKKNLQEQYKQKYKEKYGKMFKESSFLYRKIISDGDDMTFICNARFAMEYVRAYLESVQTYQQRHDSEWAYSSCAGICIFHGHYPFARAYSMAEQACDDGAKQKVHVIGKVVEEGWVDFHYIHSGIGGNLVSIRDRQGTAERMARPWLVTGGNKNREENYDQLIKLNELFQKYRVGRSDIKMLGSEYESSSSEGKRELVRVCGHHKGLKQELDLNFKDQDNLLRMIYDLSEVYDLWFKEGR